MKKMSASISISDYKKSLKQLKKKLKIEDKTKLPDNILELEKMTGWNRNDYCKVILDKTTVDNHIIKNGDIGRVYAPYNINKIVVVIFRLHKSVYVSPQDIIHYTPKGEQQ